MSQLKHCTTSEHRDVYSQALRSVNDSGVTYVMGGAFAVWYYTGVWRDTHDMDLFMPQSNIQIAVDALADAGFEDLGEQAPGDHNWIYHAAMGDFIVDLIWAFANRVTIITDEWIERGHESEFLGVKVRFMNLEDLIHSKIFTMNRHRCDWPDITRILRANCSKLDWQRLLDAMGEHWLLFSGVVDVFDWQYPADSECIPESVRKELARRRRLRRPEPAAGTREHLLDPWIHTRLEGICYWAQ